MKASEVRELSTLEIQELIESNTKALTKMRLNHAVSPLEDTTKISKTKKDIARLNTELRSRQNNPQK
ncbi:MAG: 50S ribosomal protein L29 [Salinivirgaceae bacterium]|nr:50S ribosomal protein L29 [Salinivirgaceae bacterium]